MARPWPRCSTSTTGGLDTFVDAAFADVGATTPEEVAAALTAQIEGAMALLTAGLLGVASDT